MKTANLDNFEKLISNESSGWLKKFEYYKANKNWLNKSAMIAVNVLEALKDKKLSQKQLAEKMNVSAQQINKIVKGQENLTLETISKLEFALQISLMETVNYTPVTEILTSATQIKSVATKLTTAFFVRSEFNAIPSSVKPPMRVVHNSMQYSTSQNQIAKAN